MKSKGLIQVYTGAGKGKTTAAVGLSIRALGHGLKVCYIYFHKDLSKRIYGEIKLLKRLNVDIFGFAKKHPHFNHKPPAGNIRRECLKGLEFVKQIYRTERYDVLILDEINISLRDGFLKVNEILEILNSKPNNLELILTGRGAAQEIIEKADLVSRIEKIKHPFDYGIGARRGIDY